MSAEVARCAAEAAAASQADAWDELLGTALLSGVMGSRGVRDQDPAVNSILRTLQDRLEGGDAATAEGDSSNGALLQCQAILTML